MEIIDMAKTKEELNQLKVEYETLNNKLKELSENELDYVSGGLAMGPSIYAYTDTIKSNENDESNPTIVHRKSF